MKYLSSNNRGGGAISNNSNRASRADNSTDILILNILLMKLLFTLLIGLMFLSMYEVQSQTTDNDIGQFELLEIARNVVFDDFVSNNYQLVSPPVSNYRVNTNLNNYTYKSPIISTGSNINNSDNTYRHTHIINNSTNTTIYTTSNNTTKVYFITKQNNNVNSTITGNPYYNIYQIF